LLHPKIGGAYYQMGFRDGSLLFKRGFKVPRSSPERADFARDSEDEVRRVFPEILEEVNGFADACQASYEDALGFVLGYGVFGGLTLACSAFATVSGSDVVFGRNYDFYYALGQQSRAYLTCPEGGLWNVGHSDIFTGREGGVNERGLAIAISAVEETSVKPGMNFTLAVRFALDRCENVKEAADALTGMHHSTANNFLLADKGGNIAVVEASPERVRVRGPNDGDDFIVCTNHFVHPEMLEMENREKRCWDSEVRYRAIYSMLKSRQGCIGVAEAQAILSDHSGYVCFHDKQNGLGTLWSVVATLKQQRVFRAEGHPCRNAYKEDPRLNRAIEMRSS